LIRIRILKLTNMRKGELRGMIHPCIEKIFGQPQQLREETYEPPASRLEQLYDDLETWKRLKNRDLDQYCFPFIPWIGDNYDGMRPKILYVGKATDRGWNDENTRKSNGQTFRTLSTVIKERIKLKDLAAISEFLIKKSVIPYYGGWEELYPIGLGFQSSFFDWIYRLTVSIQNDTPELFRDVGIIKSRKLSEDCFNSIAWTNFFKIFWMEKKSNLDIEMQNFLIGGVFNTLKDEIDCLKPDMIIFFTGFSYGGDLRRVLGDWKPTVNKGAFMRIELLNKKMEGLNDRAVVILSRHPQGGRTDELKELYKFLKPFR